MIVIQPGHLIVSPFHKDEDKRLAQRVESAGRVCYQSQDRAKGDSAGFVKRLIRLGHESVIEHAVVTVLFSCDRGVSHELVRHRIASYSQESTRYCRYGNNITVIAPWFVHDLAVRLGMTEHLYNPNGFYFDDHPAYGLSWVDDEKAYFFKGQKVPMFYVQWLHSIVTAEHNYLDMLAQGITPQGARSVLPNSLKTQIVVTANMREWRHIFRLRGSTQAHPDMRRLMIPLFKEMEGRFPDFFFDLMVEEDEMGKEYIVEANGG